MRFRAVVASSFVLVAGAVGFAGCGIPAESNGDFVRGEGGNGAGNKGGSAGATAKGGASAGTSAGGKAGTSSGGKGGGTVGSPCKVPADCDDQNECTADTCLPSGCSYGPLITGSACDTNRNKCDGVGNCQGTTCVIDQATKIDTADDDNCTEDVCDPVTGAVTHLPKVKESDSTKCTLAYCDPSTGKPVTRDLSIDKNECTYNECDLSVGPINTPIPTGDGDPCTKDECDVATGIITHTPISGCLGCDPKGSAEEQAKVCDDGKPCTVDRCVQGSKGAICENNLLPDNTVIDKDGTRCNGTLTCVKGDALNLDPKVVNDGLGCTADSCDAATGVVKHEEAGNCTNCKTVDDCPTVNEECRSYACEEQKKGEGKICVLKFESGKTCDDGLTCTTGDFCFGGFCLGNRAKNPSDNNVCTIKDECTEPDGVIVGEDIGNGCISCQGTNVTPCGDQTAPGQDAECVIPKCTNGKCEGVPAPESKACGAEGANPCEDRGHCDGKGKCTGPIRRPAPGCCIDAGECSPAATCKQPTTCVANKCVPGMPVVCPATVCDPADGQKYITSACGAPSGMCQPTSTSCTGGRVCDTGTCTACTAGQADQRCNSGFCKTGTAGCCKSPLDTCNPAEDCRKKNEGCPCACGAGKTCQEPLPVNGGGGAGGAAGGAAGAAGSSSTGGAGGAAPAIWVCR